MSFDAAEREMRFDAPSIHVSQMKALPLPLMSLLCGTSFFADPQKEHAS